MSVMLQSPGLKWGSWSWLVRGTGLLNPFCLQSDQNSGPGQQGWIVPCFLHPQGAWRLHCVGLCQRAACAGEAGPPPPRTLAVSSGLSGLIGLDQLLKS